MSKEGGEREREIDVGGGGREVGSITTIDKHREGYVEGGEGGKK